MKDLSKSWRKASSVKITPLAEICNDQWVILDAAATALLKAAETSSLLYIPSSTVRGHFREDIYTIHTEVHSLVRDYFGLAFSSTSNFKRDTSFSTAHELGHYLINKLDNLRSITSRFRQEVDALLIGACHTELPSNQKETIQYLSDSLEVFQKQLDVFRQIVVWLNVFQVPLYVAWAWLQATSKNFTEFLKNLGSFADRMIYLLGINLTQWCISLLPPDMADDLQLLYKELNERKKSSLNILLIISVAFLQMQIAVLVIALQDSSEGDLAFV